MQNHEKWLLKSFIVAIGGLIAALSIFWLPSLAETSAVNNPEFAYLRYPVLVVMLATTAPFFIALYKANRLLDLIAKREAFSATSVKSLKVIAYCGATIAFVYTLLGIVLFLLGALHPGILIAFAVLILTSTTISFFANLLKVLLEEALQYKNDVDLTI